MRAHTVGVVPEAEALDIAYNMGFNRFDGGDPVDPEEMADALSGFKEYAEWANHVAPDLRALAGFVDSGPGTYTVERKVVVVPEGDGDDVPADAVQMDVHHVHETLVEAFDTGAFDAMEGRDHGANAREVYLT